jgi:integrase
MPKQARFRPIKTDRGWMLSIPPKISASGNRERYFYKSKEAALAEATKLRERCQTFGNQASAISPSLAEQAFAAETLLDPLGIGLLEAVRRFVESENLLRSSVTIETATEKFRANGAAWSDSQATAYRLRCEKLCEAFAGCKIASITGDELAKHLSSTTGGPGAFNQALRLVRAIWRWCAKPPRSWCKTEAVEQVDIVRTVQGEVGILTAKQAEAVMLAAETHYPETVPAFAVALFTGLRQAEIDRLTVGDIKADGIGVPALSAKTKRRRFIAMPEPLTAWLAAYPPSGDTLTPPDWARKQRAVRRMAGFRVWSDLVHRLNVVPAQEAKPPETLPEWPDNALRHTAATVSVALGKPLESLIFEHGHSGGVTLLKRHYLGAMPKAEALKIWAIRPKLRKSGEAAEPATLAAI